MAGPLLAACGATSVVTEAPRLVIPAALKTCPPEPSPPADAADDRDLWNWVVDMAGAGRSCRNTLSALVKTIGQ